jgi:signal peptidase II
MADPGAAHLPQAPDDGRRAADVDRGADRGRRLGVVLGIGVAVAVADQLTKAWALSALADGPVHVLGPLRLALVHNTAAAFGLGGGLVPLLALAALGVVVYLIASGAAAARLPVAIAMGLLLGGAVGNLADRVFRAPGLLRGAVVDFVDLQFWPVFNVADMGITCGCVMLLLWAGRSSGPAAEAAA